MVLQSQLLKVVKDGLTEGLFQTIAIKAKQALQAISRTRLGILQRQAAELLVDFSEVMEGDVHNIAQVRIAAER